MLHIRYNDSDEYITLRMEGHSGAAPEGYDLVCCSATALATALSKYAMGHGGEVQSGKGYTNITMRNNLRAAEVSNAIVATLHDLCLDHPDCIVFK